jgi:hypothetical protein
VVVDRARHRLAHRGSGRHRACRPNLQRLKCNIRNA